MINSKEETRADTALTHGLTESFLSEFRCPWRKIRRHHDHGFALQAEDHGKNPLWLEVSIPLK